MRRFRLPVLAAVLLAGAPAAAHEPYGWREVTPDGGAGPVARSAHAIAFDGARGRLVLFGGAAEGGALLGDTWEWDGAAWTDVTPAPPAASPDARRSHAMAFDATIGRVVLFGGETAAGRSGDTWLWNGTEWERVPALAAPSARRGHATVYDPIRRVIVLAGGSSDSGFSADTWEWTGASREWTLACEGCVGIENPGAYYDATVDRVALVAGRNPSGSLSEDVRLFDGAAWTTCTKLVPAREGAIAAFDRARGVAVIHGGESEADTHVTARTACAPWDELESDGCAGPPARAGHAIAFDSRRNEIVLFGGASAVSGGAFGDTWVLGRDACAVRAGHVDTGDGSPPVDLVTVDGETGDECREVEVHAGEPVEIRIETAPSRASGRGQFALWILDDEPLPCEAAPLSFRASDGVVRSLGEATRMLPIANTVTSGAAACSAAFPRGLTSRSLGAAWANLICVEPRPGLARTPATLSVTFPPGMYTIGVLVQDDDSTLSPGKNVSIANWVVVHAE